jgi:pimeloyl-ACP methyl ester carboxylesterase
LENTKYGKNEKAGHYLTMRGFTMYYEKYGKGSPVLFIHGNSGSINNFLYQIPFFSEKYQVIIADSRAQGKSVDFGDSLSYEMMADDYSELLDSLHLDSCYVVGWSDGGINGLMLAMRHPEKVKKLAVTGANLWPDTTAVNEYVYQWAVDRYDSLMAQEANEAIKNERKLCALLTQQPHITVEELATINCPTLVIGGDHEVIKTSHTMLIANAIPRSYLWILPNSGHSTPIFYKDVFNKTVNDFFAQPYRSVEGEDRFY